MEKSDSSDTATAVRQCRNCRNRPRHWARWEGANGVWHDARCLKAKAVTRPERTCEKWVGWEDESWS